MKTNSHWKSAFLTALLTLFTAGASLAQQMNYQGRLTDSSGNAVPDAQYSITFNIFDSATAGLNKWGPQVIPADVVQGRFNVILGPTDTGSRNIVSAFDGGTRYLQITYQGNPILPRQQILSSPTAFYSQTAGQLANVFVLNGNVGIGTSSPATTLDVRSATPAITVGTSGGIEGALYFGNTNHGVKRNFGGPDSVGLYTTAGDLYLSSAGISTSQFVLKNSGNVGIGTNAPAQRLHVASSGVKTSGQSYPLIFSTSEATSPFGVETRIIGAALLSDRVAVLQTADVNTTNGGNLSLQAYAGNVGIGTTAPTAKLDVAGDIKNTGLTYQGSGTGAAGPGAYGIITRRVSSLSSTAGTVVATCKIGTNGSMSLVRDGTNGGLTMTWVNPDSRPLMITNTRLDTYGTPFGFFYETSAVSGSGVQVITNEAWPDVRVTFGNPYNDGGFTEVHLFRRTIPADNYYIGTITSTTNQ